MSTDSFRDFITKVQQDAGLQEELRARFGDPAAGIPSNELAEFAAGKGYTFTVEEVSAELSDEQLGAVSGGFYDAFSQRAADPWDDRNVFPKVVFNLPSRLA